MRAPSPDDPFAATIGRLGGGDPVPGTFTYSPASGTVLAPGVSHTLKVVFTPDDPAVYATAHASASVSVNAKVTPTLTWDAPGVDSPRASRSTARS